jgi:coenzyme F420-0:L-glutamate ligase/coenzyme F420-1:gamma-L-glutamate ligase
VSANKISPLEVFPIEGLPEVQRGDDLAGLIASAEPGLQDGDVVVVTQKVVSKAEGAMAEIDAADPRGHKAIVEAESVRIIRRRGDLIISETKHGFVCANAGVDLSNVDEGWAALLPEDSDRSARRIRDGLRASLGVDVAVIVSDTFGRPWRRGLTDVAIGCAGIRAVVDLRGTEDTRGRELQVTEVCVVDELAGAAELVMGKASGVAAAVVRGVDPGWLGRGEVRAEVVRPPQEDLFR